MYLILNTDQVQKVLETGQVRKQIRASNRVYSRIEVGDTLWVKETWMTFGCNDEEAPCELNPEISPIWYLAGLEPTETIFDIGKKRSATTMPRWASRLTLEVTSVMPKRTDGAIPWAWVYQLRRVT